MIPWSFLPLFLLLSSAEISRGVPIPKSSNRLQSRDLPYSIQDVFIGHSFFDNFDWFTQDDPTHGRVDYVSIDEAIGSNLSYASNDKFVMRADDQNVVSGNSRGRKSVRISSKKTYTDSVIILDADHMPEGCGTWPAFWSVSRTGWPVGGEIDIIEGSNDIEPNFSTLHTTGGCTMPENRDMTGKSLSTQCSVEDDPTNTGCGVGYPQGSNSYGKSFNRNGGGWYAMQRSNEGIFIWFWPRNANNVPNEVKNGGNNIDVSSWGRPSAAFVNQQCDMQSHFNDHTIVINLTFCGDMAGATYNTAGCPGSCVDFVNNNPQSFSNAFWSINSLRTYTPGRQAGRNLASSSHKNTVKEGENTKNETTEHGDNDNNDKPSELPISTTSSSESPATPTGTPTQTNDSNEDKDNKQNPKDDEPERSGQDYGSFVDRLNKLINSGSKAANESFASTSNTSVSLIQQVIFENQEDFKSLVSDFNSLKLSKRSSN